MLQSKLPCEVATAWIILAIELNLFYHTLIKNIPTTELELR
jgi:hypothetical protein